MTLVHTCTSSTQVPNMPIYGVRKVRLPKQQEQIACWLACSAHSKAHIAHSCVVVVSYVRKHTQKYVYTTKNFVNLALEYIKHTRRQQTHTLYNKT